MLPVFVFSMSDLEGDAALFDGSLPFAASKDAVLVVQSGAVVGDEGCVMSDR